MWPGILFCYTYFSTFADTLVLATIRGGGKTVHVVFNYMSRSLSPNLYTFKDPMSRFQGIDSASLACAIIFQLLRNPGIDSKGSIQPAYVAWRAGATTLFLLGS